MSLTLSNLPATQKYPGIVCIVQDDKLRLITSHGMDICTLNTSSLDSLAEQIAEFATEIYAAGHDRAMEKVKDAALAKARHAEPINFSMAPVEPHAQCISQEDRLRVFSQKGVEIHSLDASTQESLASDLPVLAEKAYRAGFDAAIGIIRKAIDNIAPPLARSIASQPRSGHPSNGPSL